MNGKQTKMEKSTEILKLDKAIRPVIIRTILLGYVCTWNTHALDTSRYKWQLCWSKHFPSSLSCSQPSRPELPGLLTTCNIVFCFCKLKNKKPFLKKETDCYFCLLWNIHHSNDYNAQNQSFRFVFPFYLQFFFSFLNFPPQLPTWSCSSRVSMTAPLLLLVKRNKIKTISIILWKIIQNSVDGRTTISSRPFIFY